MRRKFRSATSDTWANNFGCRFHCDSLFRKLRLEPCIYNQRITILWGDVGTLNVAGLRLLIYFKLFGFFIRFPAYWGWELLFVR